MAVLDASLFFSQERVLSRAASETPSKSKATLFFLPMSIPLDKSKHFCQNCKMLPIIAICVSILCSGTAIWMSLRAIARVASYEVSTKDMDWEAVAKLTGDIASVKRGIQTVNNRLNGMETSRTSQANALDQVRAAQANQGSVSYLGG